MFYVDLLYVGIGMYSERFNMVSLGESMDTKSFFKSVGRSVLKRLKLVQLTNASSDRCVHN